MDKTAKTTTTTSPSSTISTVVSTTVTSPLIKRPVDTPSVAPTTVVSSLNHPISQPNSQSIDQLIQSSSMPMNSASQSAKQRSNLKKPSSDAKSAKEHIQKAAKSKEPRDAQNGTDPCLFDEAFNFIRTGQLTSFASLEDYIRRFETAFVVLEQNDIGLNDKLKSKFFFCGMGRVQKELEQHALKNKLNYNEMLGHVRDKYSPEHNEHLLCGVDHPKESIWGKQKSNEGPKHRKNRRPGVFKTHGYRSYKKGHSSHGEKSEKRTSKDGNDDKCLPKKFGHPEVGQQDESKQLVFLRIVRLSFSWTSSPIRSS